MLQTSHSNLLNKKKSLSRCLTSYHAQQKKQESAQQTRNNKTTIMIHNTTQYHYHHQLVTVTITKFTIMKSTTTTTTTTAKPTTTHVIGVCLLSQSASGKHNQEKKPMYLCAPPKFPQNMCLLCLIIIQSCYFDYRMNKSFAYSQRVICVSFTVRVISAYYARKGSRFFILITHKSTRLENLIT